MNNTPNYNLKKPVGNETAGPGAFNDNADIIDAQLKANADAAVAKQDKTNSLTEETALGPLDYVAGYDSSAAAHRKFSLGSVEVWLKSIFDSVYAAISHTQTASTITDFVATVRSTVLTGISTATDVAIAASDSVLGALGKLQAQVTAHRTNTNNPHGTTVTQAAAAGGILPIANGGHAGNTAAAGVYNLINALSAIAPATGDKIPLLDISGGVAGYSTIANILALLGNVAQIATGSFTPNNTARNISLGVNAKFVVCWAAPQITNSLLGTTYSMALVTPSGCWWIGNRADATGATAPNYYSANVPGHAANIANISGTNLVLSAGGINYGGASSYGTDTAGTVNWAAIY